MKISNPNAIQRLHSGVFINALSALAISAFAYVTQDKPADVLTDGYFNNADKHIPDISVMKVISLPDAKTVNVFDLIVRKVPQKPTKKNPSSFTYKVEKIEAPAPDLTDVEKRLAALEAIVLEEEDAAGKTPAKPKTKGKKETDDKDTGDDDDGSTSSVTKQA